MKRLFTLILLLVAFTVTGNSQSNLFVTTYQSVYDQVDEDFGPRKESIIDIYIADHSNKLFTVILYVDGVLAKHPPITLKFKHKRKGRRWYTYELVEGSGVPLLLSKKSLSDMAEGEKGRIMYQIGDQLYLLELH